MAEYRMTVLLALLLSATAPATVSAQLCVGDCNGDGAVTVDEIVRGVRIALGDLVVDDCPAADGDLNGSVTVDEIVTAVNNALNGCPTVCDLNGLWQVTVTELDPPQPPDVLDLPFTQDDLGVVTTPPFPAFQARNQGQVLRVDYCDCSPEELLCNEGDLAIAVDCNSFGGILSFVEFDSVLACLVGDPAMGVGNGREQVDAIRVVEP